MSFILNLLIIKVETSSIPQHTTSSCHSRKKIQKYHATLSCEVGYAWRLGNGKKLWHINNKAAKITSFQFCHLKNKITTFSYHKEDYWSVPLVRSGNVNTEAKCNHFNFKILSQTIMQKGLDALRATIVRLWQIDIQ